MATCMLRCIINGKIEEPSDRSENSIRKQRRALGVGRRCWEHKTRSICYSYSYEGTSLESMGTTIVFYHSRLGTRFMAL